MRVTRWSIVPVAVLVALVASLPGAAQSPLPSTAAAIVDLDRPLAGPDVLPTDQESADTITAIRDGTFGTRQVDAVVALLASVGVEVVTDAGERLVTLTGPPSPLRYADRCRLGRKKLPR